MQRVICLQLRTNRWDDCKRGAEEASDKKRHFFCFRGSTAIVTCHELMACANTQNRDF